MKRSAAGLAAKITEKLKITPVMEKGEHGQLDIFVDQKLIASQTGILKRLFGPSKDALVAEIAKHLSP